jgi:hypothetical protein
LLPETNFRSTAIHRKMIQITLRLAFFLIFFFAINFLFSKNIVVIEDKNVPRNQKEAILILPGFGSKLNGTKAQRRFFAKKGYDLFIPDYLSRKSMAATLEKFDRFFEKQHLNEYRKIHVFSYLVGSWTINNWIEKHPENNIFTIIYDRSPLQERAPQVVVSESPLINFAAGPVLRDFSRMPYPVLQNKNGIRTGIIIESKATKYIKRHKKAALALGPVRWDFENLGQPADDFFYTWLDHDRMYKRFDVIGEEIFFFIKNGRFSENARRKPFEEDPFLPFLEKN